MTSRHASSEQLDWLLADFARRTPGVGHGLVVGGDGLRLAASERMAVVTAAQADARPAALRPESLAIVRMCARPQSLAEVGAALRVPVGVARVLVGDLVNAGYLVAHLPTHTSQDGRPSQAVLGRSRR